MANKFTSKPERRYRSRRNEFYAMCAILLSSCKSHLARFTAHKSIYTLTYITNLTNELLAAAAIPVYQLRSMIVEELHRQLMLKTDECLAKWQLLKTYIMQAFTEEEYKMNFEGAGIEFYNRAANYSWEDLSSLMTTASQYITQQSAKLTADGYMPATFQAELDTLRADALIVFTNFEDKMNYIKNQTNDKINKENVFFKKMMLLCKDGRQIFRYEPGPREEFTYTKVLERIRGVSSAFHEFEIPANSQIVIKKLVNSTPFENIDITDLIVCNGNTTCTVDTGATVLPGATTLIQEGIETITVLNTNPTIKGKCKVRVIKK